MVSIREVSGSRRQPTVYTCFNTPLRTNSFSYTGYPALASRRYAASSSVHDTMTVAASSGSRAPFGAVLSHFGTRIRATRFRA